MYTLQLQFIRIPHPNTDHHFQIFKGIDLERPTSNSRAWPQSWLYWFLLRWYAQHLNYMLRVLFLHIRIAGSPIQIKNILSYFFGCTKQLIINVHKIYVTYDTGNTNPQLNSCKSTHSMSNTPTECRFVYEIRMCLFTISHGYKHGLSAPRKSLFHK